MFIYLFAVTDAVISLAVSQGRHCSPLQDGLPYADTVRPQSFPGATPSTGMGNWYSFTVPVAAAVGAVWVDPAMPVDGTRLQVCDRTHCMPFQVGTTCACSRQRE